MHRSHSRSAYPFDTFIPCDIRHWRAWRLPRPWHRKRSSAGDAVIRRMHIRKQRQYNRLLIQLLQDSKGDLS